MAANKTSFYTLSWWETALYWALFGLTYIMSLLPLRVHYLLSDVVYCIVYYVVRYRVGLVRKNLRDSFPDKTDRELHDMEKAFYHFFSDYIVETIKLMTISREEMCRRMTFSGVEHINDATRQGRSVSLYLGHYCNWEWITCIGLHIDPDVYGGQVYHILENRIFDKFFLYLRSRMNSTCVPMSEILRRRIECQRKGQPMVMGYIADQVPLWNNIHYWTDFLHHDTPVLTGAEKLTKRFGDVALYLDISRPRRGYYHADIIPLADGDTRTVPDYDITEAYFRALENTIRRQPEFWLWTHNRWKRGRREWLSWLEAKAKQ